MNSSLNNVKGKQLPPASNRPTTWENIKTCLFLGFWLGVAILFIVCVMHIITNVSNDYNSTRVDALKYAKQETLSLSNTAEKYAKSHGSYASNLDTLIIYNPELENELSGEITYAANDTNTGAIIRDASYDMHLTVFLNEGKTKLINCSGDASQCKSIGYNLGDQ